MTAKECRERTNNTMIPYRLWMRCDRRFEPDEESGFKADTEGAYACPDKYYTVIREKTIRCVENRKDCGDFWIADDLSACVETPAICY